MLVSPEQVINSKQLIYLLMAQKARADAAEMQKLNYAKQVALIGVTLRDLGGKPTATEFNVKSCSSKEPKSRRGFAVEFYVHGGEDEEFLVMGSNFSSYEAS